MTGATAEMSRLVVCGPDRQIEVAVPAGVLVVDLLPALLHHLGEGLADAGLAHGGWVLQRAGSAPLDEESTVAALGLRDGETVFLRPRADQLPEVDFDDVIDGVATGMRNRPGRWRPEMTGWAVSGVTGVLLACGLAAPALAGPVAVRAAASLLFALLALAGGAAVVRAAGERSFGAVLASGAVAYAGSAGLILPLPTEAALGLPSASQTLAGTALAAAVAVIAAGLLGAATRLFTALATALLLGAVGGATALGLGLTGGQSAAVVAVLATAFVPIAPVIAFRLGGLRLAPLPTRPEHLQEELDPEPAGPLMSRARAVDAHLTALYAGLGTAATVALPIAATSPGWAGPALAVLVALVLLLSARPMTGAWHRLAMAVPGLAGLGAAAIAGLALLPPLFPLLALAVLLVVVPALLGLGRTMSRRRMMPYWGRVGDISLLLAAVALLPVLLAVLEGYGYFRGIGG